MSGSRGKFRLAGRHVGDGEIETTGIEKFLAVVLAVFIAIGAIWTYVKLDDVVTQDSTSLRLSARELSDREELAAIAQHRQAIRSVQVARSDRRAATRALEISREAYRTALDAGQPAADLQVRYEAAQARLTSASAELAAAVAVEARSRPQAAEAQERLTEQREDAAKRADDDRVRHDQIVFVLRLALLTLMLAGAYLLLSRLRSRHSRYLPAALAWIGATAVLAIFMAADYSDSYIEFDEVGPLAISVVGVGLTLIAFVALQRFLAKRVPARRVRRGECPFCGFRSAANPTAKGAGAWSWPTARAVSENAGSALLVAASVGIPDVEPGRVPALSRRSGTQRSSGPVRDSGIGAGPGIAHRGTNSRGRVWTWGRIACLGSALSSSTAGGY